MKSLKVTKRIMALALALVLAFSSAGVQSLAAYAAETPIDESLTVPFGLGADYDAEKGIGVVWGAAGYELYTVTISKGDYTKVYADQQLGYHYYPDEYTAGEYTISVQGQEEGKFSPAGTTTVTVPGEIADNGSGTPSETETSVTDLTLTWAIDGNGTVANANDNGSAADITVNDTGADPWSVQYCAQPAALEVGEKYVFSGDFECEQDAKCVINIQTTTNWSGLISEPYAFDIAAGEKKHVEIVTNEVTDTFASTTKIAVMFGLSENVGKTISVSNLKIEKGENVTPVDEVSAEEQEEEVDLSGIDFETLNHKDYIDAGTDVTVKYEGVKAIVTGSDWGNDWGNDSHWQIQLKEVVSTPLNEKYDVSFKVKTEKAREIFVKLGDINNDGTVYGEGTYTLPVGTTKIHMTTDKPVDIDDMMIDFALGTKWGSEQNTITISNLKVSEHKEVAVKEGAIDFGNANTELYVGGDWAGAAADVKESGTVAEIAAESYGWNGEWGLQYIIHDLGLKSGETYTFSVDITSSIDKKILLKVDDSGQIVDTIELEAGTLYEYSKEVTVSQVANDKLYFAIGMMSGETANLTGTMTIQNLVIQDSEGNYLVLTGGDAIGAKGPEYDFTADNSEYDFADPGLVKDGYQLIWNDEFDGNYGNANVDKETGLNLDNWAYQLGDGTTDCGNTGWGNNELQSYTNRSENIAVNEDLNGDGEGEGVLRITASHEDSKYFYANESGKDYTSARIRTTSPDGALFTTTYGYAEARISLPETQGAWPAFWMLPESTEIYGGWPVSGEIDILETTGTRANEACSTLHWGTPTHVYKGSGYTKLDSEIMYFHTYAVDWEPGKFTFYYDGKEIYTSTNWESAFGGASDSLSFDAPFDMPFYLILNLAVDSGQFGGTANKANFKDDINMYVDYVRVFQKADGYAASVERQASDDAKEDWVNYAGKNQIAEIAADNLDATGGVLDDSKADKSNWYLSTQSDARASATVVTDDNGKVWHKIDVGSAGSQDYSVQLIGHYDAKPGYVYKVSFDSYAEGDIAGKTANCDSKEYAGWSTYGVTQFKLGSEPSRTSFTFQQTESFDNCRIEFNLGAQAAGSVYISNVKVEIVDPATLGQTEKGRTALTDGNLIYNGDFSQGTGHFGYWAAKENTIVSIPRYTVSALSDDDVKVVDVASKTNSENVADGIKYYERRAEISAKEGIAPTIYQPGIPMIADEYTVSFDLYSETATAVKVSVLDANGQEAAAKTVSYDPASGVRTITVGFDVTEDLGTGILQFTFAKGTSVQLDNVSMYGKNQALPIDETPIDEDTTWTGDSGAGNTLELINEEDGAKKLAGITSGGTWYSPQIGSSNFQVVSGVKYRLTYKYKTDLSKHKFIVQENGGSWRVANDIVEVSNEGRVADENGYLSYELEFISKESIDSCHLNFGFGDSNATNGYFVFKDVSLTVVKATESGDTVTDEDEVDNGQFVDDVVVTEPGNNTGNNNSGSGNTNTGNTGAGNTNAGNTPVADTAETPAAGNTTAPVTVRPGRTDEVVTPEVTEEVEEEDTAEEIAVDDEEAPLTAEITGETPASDEEGVVGDEEPVPADERSSGFAGIVIAIVAACALLAAGLYAFLKAKTKKNA